MRLIDYIWPDNLIALWIVVSLLGLFALWFILLLGSVFQCLGYRRQIRRCKDVGHLAEPPAKSPGDGGPLPPASAREGEERFEAFKAAKGLKERSPVEEHLRAIFSAGWNESHLDARALLKSTADRLFRAHGLHRALLSVFIVLGLLGTLFGLADALALLAEALGGGGAQVDNERLNQGLQHLLSSLKGAFGPSILGVLLTVVGVVLFALYLRLVAAPLASALEYATLTIWVPRLMPTASQKLLDKLQLSERQMEANFEAAQKVAKFAEGAQQKTSAFNETLGRATDSLSQMRQVSDRLDKFSQDFIEAMQGIKPFEQELRSLYKQMVDESRAFQESVRLNIAGSEEFQRHIQGQLDSQHRELSEVIGALRSYEKAYVSSRGSIDAKLGEVLEQAGRAFENLSRRNDEIARALDEALGRPLRETVSQQLSAVEGTLGTRLSGVEDTLNVQLGALGDRLRDIDRPLNTAADKFTDTFHNFNEYAAEWRGQLQREFAKQNETSQQQLHRLDALSEQVPDLLKQISASSNNFTAGGQQLSRDIEWLSQNVAVLGRNVDALGQQVGGRPGGDGDATAELLRQQIEILRGLSQRLERVAAAASAPRTYVGAGNDKPVDYVPPRPGWRERVRGWVPFIRRR